MRRSSSKKKDAPGFTLLADDRPQANACAIASIPPGLSPEDAEVFATLDENARNTIAQAPVEIQASVLRIHALTKGTSVTLEDAATQVGSDAHKAIIHKAKDAEQLKFTFAPFPTELTRTSPFFPLSTQEMAQREYIRDMVIADHSWGRITYSGPKLSVYEEDLLIVLLAALNDANNRRIGDVDGQRTYTYRGSLRQIITMQGIKHPGKNHYDTALRAFKLMTGATFELVTSASRKQKKTVFKNLIVGGEYDHESGAFIVSINPYFYECYSAGTVTWIDAIVRGRIKSPIAKAMYRFVQSHRDPVWCGQLMTIAAALNLDTGLAKRKIRERLKNAIAELVNLGILEQTTKIEDDIVTLFRCKTPKKALQKLPG